MKILALDSSTKHFSLAIAKDNKILSAKNVVLKKVLSDSIVPAIEDSLKKAKLKLPQIDGFAVGLGPGSFTSLRVGLATVKALCLATDKPLVGIPSLDVLTMNINAPGAVEVCTLVDARRNLAYGCFYRKEGEQLKRKTQYLLAPVSDILKTVKGRMHFIGDGALLYRKDIEASARLSGDFEPVFADERHCFPRAQELAHLALKMFDARKLNDVNKIIPVYLYPDDCQIQ